MELLNSLLKAFGMMTPTASGEPEEDDFDMYGLIPSLLGTVGTQTAPGNIYGPSTHEQWGELINKHAQAAGLNPRYVEAIMMNESRGNPGARSPVGATGLMQLMPGTAKAMGVQNPLDPEQNIMGGVKYLKQMMDEFGDDPELVAAAYNAGPGNVRKHGGIPPFKETQAYASRVKKTLYGQD